MSENTDSVVSVSPVSASSLNSTANQGTATASSGAVASANVTASVTVSTGKTVNPFVVPVPAVPTQEGPLGIRYDFNDGARVLLPRANGTFKLKTTKQTTLFLPVMPTKAGYSAPKNIIFRSASACGCVGKRNPS